MLAATSPPDVVFLFAAAGFVLYIASRAAVDALTRAEDPSPGRTAIALWMPIAWTAILATLAGNSEVGIGIVFGTSVAVLSLDLGVLTLMSPPPPVTPPGARVWPFVIPAALIALLAGFSGSLAWWHAMMMVLLGIAVFMVWSSSESTSSHSSPASPARLRIPQLLLAIALGALGAWLGYRAIMTADVRTRVATSGLIAAAVMSPLLALPILGSGAIAAQHGKMPAVMSSIVLIVLLNLSCLLPVVVMCDYIRRAVLTRQSTAMRALEILPQLGAVPFPLAVWRVDTVLLIVLGLALVPISLGRLTLSKYEGAWLAVIYVAYLFVSAAIVIRL